MSAADPSWLHELEHCPSTNTWALQAGSRLPHGDVVFTRRQSAGRGQAGRSWLSDPGVLTASVVLDLPCPRLGPRLALAAGLALCHAIEDRCGPLPLGIKWPNDLILQNRKLAGILCEGRSQADGLRAVVGIGCNCRPDWGSQPPAASHYLNRPPISLHDVHAAAPEPRELLPGLRRYLLEATGMLSSGQFEALLPELRRRHWLRNRNIHIQQATQSRLVLADEILDDGRLQVLFPDGGSLALDSPLAISGIAG